VLGERKRDVVRNEGNLGRSADEKLVQHINGLQEQFHAERREIRRRKGA
jgi:hypothetical protein